MKEPTKYVVSCPVCARGYEARSQREAEAVSRRWEHELQLRTFQTQAQTVRETADQVGRLWPASIPRGRIDLFVANLRELADSLDLKVLVERGKR